MKSYVYIFFLFWVCTAVVYCKDCPTSSENCPLTSSILENFLPADHSCLSVRYETRVDIPTVMGRWYLLTLLCESWGRIPMCDMVDFNQNGSQIQERWRSLDLLDHPVAASTADYKTTLNVVEPGVWVDTKPDKGYSVYLVLSAWHPFYLVLLRCYPKTPNHMQDMFILGRYTEHVQRDLDLHIDMAKAQGIDDNLNTQYVLWSMCERHLQKIDA